MSHLTDKSDALQQAAALLHEKGLHPAAAHPAYYSCYQLMMMHIWLHRMKKTVQELAGQRSSHEYLIWAVGEFIRNSKEKGSGSDFYTFRIKAWELKRLRTNADYSDKPFGAEESARGLRLSAQIIPILKKY
jgi:hypothetical protein